MRIGDCPAHPISSIVRSKEWVANPFSPLEDPCEAHALGAPSNLLAPTEELAARFHLTASKISDLMWSLWRKVEGNKKFGLTVKKSIKFSRERAGAPTEAQAASQGDPGAPWAMGQRARSRAKDILVERLKAKAHPLRNI